MNIDSNRQRAAQVQGHPVDTVIDRHRVVEVCDEATCDAGEISRYFSLTSHRYRCRVSGASQITIPMREQPASRRYSSDFNFLPMGVLRLIRVNICQRTSYCWS